MWLLVCLSALWEIFRPVWPRSQGGCGRKDCSAGHPSGACGYQYPSTVSLMYFPIALPDNSFDQIFGNHTCCHDDFSPLSIGFPQNTADALLDGGPAPLQAHLSAEPARLPGFPACQAAPPAMPPDGSLVLQGKYQRTAFHAKSQKRVSFSDF